MKTQLTETFPRHQYAGRVRNKRGADPFRREIMQHDLSQALPKKAGQAKVYKSIIDVQGLSPDQTRLVKQRSEVSAKADSIIEHYKVQDKLIVRRFIMRNPFLISLLSEIPEKVRNSFSPDQKLILNFLPNAENSEYSELSIIIPTTFGWAEATERLERFDQDWWLENLSRGRGKVTVSLRFVDGI